MMRRIFALMTAMVCTSAAIAQNRAPDASAVGGAVVVGNYSVNATQLRAVVYRPNAPAGPSPLVLVMHGNHSVCGRLYDPAPVGPDPIGLPCTRPVGGGACTEAIRIDFENYAAAPRTCPVGFTEAPSYMGYEYLGRRLASQGYVVVSIDA